MNDALSPAALRDVGLLLGALAAVALQTNRPHSGRGGSTATNLGVWLLGALLTGGLCAWRGICAAAVAQRAARADFGLLHVAEIPAVVSIPLTVLALDFVSYAWHRANHAVPLLWRFHCVHHSDPRFTVSTGLRFHPGELLLSLPLRLVAVAVLGAPVEAVLVFEVLFNLSNLVEHGDIDLPAAGENRLAMLFVTPALHRRHHARSYPELDSNFATIFSVWDRLFRSYRHCTSAERFDVGLPGLDGSPSLLETLELPFARPARRE